MAWEYQYDSAGNLTAYQRHNKDGDLVKSVDISYDTGGKIVEENISLNGLEENKSYEFKRTYSYLEDGKLEAVDINGEKEWQLTYEEDRLVKVGRFCPILDLGVLYDSLHYYVKYAYEKIDIEGPPFIYQYIEDCLGIRFPVNLNLGYSNNWEITYTAD